MTEERPSTNRKPSSDTDDQSITRDNPTAGAGGLPSMEGPVCPVPLLHGEKIVLGHGSGGKMMNDLIARTFLPPLDNPPRNKRERRQAYADRAARDLESFLSEQTNLIVS